VTLILGALTKGYAFQVGDRLVSLKSGGQLRDFDPLANKQIVLLATDALTSFGYTGLAFMSGGLPTDRWIAEQITGVDLGGGGFIAWQSSTPMHLQAVVDRLTAALEAEFARLPRPLRSQPLTIQIVGIARRRGNRARPLAWEITHSAPFRGHFAVTKHELASLRWDAGYFLLPSGTNDAQALDEMREHLKARGEQSPEAFRSILVDGIRATAATARGVGAHCMAVQLVPAAGTVNIDVEYLPAVEQLLTVNAREAEHVVPAAYSPWIILQGFVFAPLVLISDQTWHSGDIQVRLRAPSSDAGFTYAGSQPRKAGPGAGP